MNCRIYLKKGRTKSLRRKHPWVYSGAIKKIDGHQIDGELCEVRSIDDEFFGIGCHELNSKIAVRMLTWANEPVDDSTVALEMAKKNVIKNGFPLNRIILIRDDIFSFLRQTKDYYDFIILDPPAFAKNQKHVLTAAQGYKDINLNAIKLLRPNGMLLTFSCSHYITPDFFQKIIFGAALDAKKNFQIGHRLGHPPDHPVSIYHPEGEYLKGLLGRVTDL